MATGVVTTLESGLSLAEKTVSESLWAGFESLVWLFVLRFKERGGACYGVTFLCIFTGFRLKEKSPAVELILRVENLREISEETGLTIDLPTSALFPLSFHDITVSLT